MHPEKPKRPEGRLAQGAGNGTRTRDIQLGKLTLYQLSYSRDAAKLARNTGCRLTEI